MGDADCRRQSVCLRLDPARGCRRPTAAAEGKLAAVAGARRRLPGRHAQRLAGSAGRAHHQRQARATDRAAATDLPAAVSRRSLPAAAVLGLLFKLYLARVVRWRSSSPACSSSRRSAPGLRATTVRCQSGSASACRRTPKWPSAPSWLALICALVADGTLFTSLLFGTFYLWIAAPNWPGGVRPIRAACLRLARLWRSSSPPWRRGFATHTCRRRQGPGLDVPRHGGVLAAIASVAGMIVGVTPHPREHALGATAVALLSYVALHAGIGLALPGQQPAAHRAAASFRVGADRPSADATLARLHGWLPAPSRLPGARSAHAGQRAGRAAMNTSGRLRRGASGGSRPVS